MRFFQKEEVKTDNPYLGLRQQALSVKPEQLGVTLDNNEQVYAAVVDLPVTHATVTLACFFDGTVSLYYSNGGGMLGAGQKHEEVRKAGMSFLFSAGQTLKFLEKTDNLDLPHRQGRMRVLIGERWCV